MLWGLIIWSLTTQVNQLFLTDGSKAQIVAPLQETTYSGLETFIKWDILA